MQAKQEVMDSANIPILADYYNNNHEYYDLLQAEGSEPIEGTASSFKTTFNGLMNALLGITILSVPYVLSTGGWLSLILLLIIACATCYTGILIKRCMEVDPNTRSYPDIGYKAFGAKGRLIVSLFMNLEIYLIPTGFNILVADNLHNLLPNVQVNIQGFIISGRQTFLLLAALIIMPTVWIDTPTTLSYVSATGVVATIIITCSVFWSGMFDGIGFHQKGELLKWSGLPTSLSLYTLLLQSSSFPYSVYFDEKQKTVQMGFGPMFCDHYSCLCINGGYGVPNVRFRIAISDNSEPPYK